MPHSNEALSTHGELDSRPPGLVVRARGTGPSPAEWRAAVPKAASRGSATASPRSFDGQFAPIFGILGLCVERGLWPRLCGGGPSPLRTAIPANREFNREFCRFPCCRRTARPRQVL